MLIHEIVVEWYITFLLIEASFTLYRVGFRTDTQIIPLCNVIVQTGAVFHGTEPYPICEITFTFESVGSSD